MTAKSHNVAGPADCSSDRELRKSAPSIKEQRTGRVFQAGLSAIVSKGIVLGVNAITIPIAVRYLGPEQFGVWVTISTTLSILVLLDLGVASTMTNYISEAYALDDRMLAGQYASVGLWTMLLIALALGCIGIAIWPFVSWSALFHLSQGTDEREISHAVAAGYLVYLAGLPAGLATKYLAGYQEIKTANIFSAIGAAGNLVAVFLVVWLRGGLALLVAASSGAMVATNFACLGWLWLYHKPWLAPRLRHWSLASVRSMMRSGGEFFVLQLTGLVVYNSDNLVIAHYLGPAQVTPYSVTWKLVSYSAALQTIITPALWPAYAEAFIQRDYQWMRRTVRYVMLATMGTAGICCVVFAVWGMQIIRIWAGAAAVPSETLVLLMCLWILICTFTANTATILMATNETKLQSRLSVLAAIVNLVSSIWLVQRIGPSGVILGTIVSFLLFLVGPQTRKMLQVLYPVSRIVTQDAGR